MAIYIIQPANPDELPLAPSPAFTANAERVNRLKMIRDIRRQDQAFGPFIQWLRKSKKPFLGSREGMLAVGTAVVDLSDEEAEMLQADVPGLRLTRDREVTVFRPQIGRRKDDLEDGDLWHLDEIGLAEARRNGFTGTGAGVRIAVLDTGVDSSHPELGSKIAEHHIFDPATGTIQVMDPGNDTDGHGTLIAGLICGDRIGVAPGARVISVVMLPRGRGGLANFVIALGWAATRPGLRVLNISSGLPGFVPEMAEPLKAVISAGILPVVATGDGGAHALTYSPGNHEGVLSVGASARDDDGSWIPPFSSGGRFSGSGRGGYVIPDLVAPGQVVISSRQGGGFAFFNGSSLSAPIVAGVAALIIEKNPAIGVNDLVKALLGSCVPLVRRPPERQGAGVVRVKPALP